MYLTVHSYGQYFLYPWGYESLDTHDRRDLHNMGQIGARAIQSVNGRRRYKVGSAAKMLYPASGKCSIINSVVTYNLILCMYVYIDIITYICIL